MIAITVSVEYHDFLARTLPWNVQHFEEVLVVTTPDDRRAAGVAGRTPRASVFTTNAFTRGNAMFNKGAALNEAIDYLDYAGWVVLVDADTMIPQDVDLDDYHPTVGHVYLAQRRQCPSLDDWNEKSTWDDWPLIPEVLHASGHFILFHTQDAMLAQRPRYPTNWTDAGGSAADFIGKWPMRARVYFPWHCLHLGPLRENWCGRVTAYQDGEYPDERGPRVRRMLTLAKEEAQYGDFTRRVR